MVKLVDQLQHQLTYQLYIEFQVVAEAEVILLLMPYNLDQVSIWPEITLYREYSVSQLAVMVRRLKI